MARRTKPTIFFSLACLVLAGCDDQEQQPMGGGPGSSATPADATNVQANAAGPCSPVGGADALGSASYTTSSIAKIDSDGDPNAQGQDADWQPQTSGGVNAGTYSFVVMSEDQMAASGVSIGDWAVVTNNATGQQTWAKVQDKGPRYGTGEISEAAATQVGIQYTSNRFTVGNPSVTVQAYGGTADVSSDCSQLAANP
jgi:hypothetical protein